jgi:transglutaminase-like putative cysteine protease
MIQMNWLKSVNKITFLLLVTTFGIAQNISDFQKKYPGYSELILSETQTYDFTIQKNKLQVLQDNYYESIILSDIGIQNNSESFTYSELVPLKSFDAFTIINDNGRDKKIPIKQTNDKNATQNSIFFSDVKERKLTFSNLEIGAKKVYSYQSEFLDPYLLHKYIFANTIPMEKSSLEINTDENIEIGYKIFNDPNNEITFNKTTKKGKINYNWTLNQVNPLKYESNNPGYLYIAPHVIVYIKNYKINDKKIDVLGNTDQLYEYYKGFVKNLNTTEDENLKQITLELTQNLLNDEEKIKAIFYWVKDNIKYVAFENGYEGFIPRDAKLVNERKFGDCKDMSSIITEMAKYANIPNVNICWIGTRRIPYTYKDISTPAVDDHMIASFENKDKIIFLDATDKETRFGLPTGFIQGKDALIRNGDYYKIVTVPIVKAQENMTEETLKLKINQNKIEGSGKLSINGLTRSRYLSSIGDASNKARFEMIKSLVLKGNNKFNLKDFKEENISNRDLSYNIEFYFDLDNYTIQAGNELYVNLFLDKPFEKIIIEKDRKSMYEFDVLIKNKFNFELEIPADKIVQTIPKNSSLDNELMKYSINYIHTDKNVTLQFEIELKKILLDVSDFYSWNECIKNLKSHYNDTIILVKK